VADAERIGTAEARPGASRTGMVRGLSGWALARGSGIIGLGRRIEKADMRDSGFDESRSIT
jgi:hypothetical protein